MHELIVSPFLGNYIVVRPGRRNGVKIPYSKYRELTQDIPGGIIPVWLAETACRAWDLDLSGRPVAGTVLVRSESPFGYGCASYELNLGCNYDCEHCYLGLKKFEGLSWLDRERLLHIMRDAGVLWLQLTGGEPMIDRLFTQVYTLAYDLGMMLTILSNGSRLSNSKILDLLTSRSRGPEPPGRHR